MCILISFLEREEKYVDKASEGQPANQSSIEIEKPNILLLLLHLLQESSLFWELCLNTLYVYPIVVGPLWQCHQLCASQEKKMRWSQTLSVLWMLKSIWKERSGFSLAPRVPWAKAVKTCFPLLCLSATVVILFNYHNLFLSVFSLGLLALRIWMCLFISVFRVQHSAWHTIRVQ